MATTPINSEADMRAVPLSLASVARDILASGRVADLKEGRRLFEPCSIWTLIDVETHQAWRLRDGKVTPGHWINGWFEDAAGNPRTDANGYLPFGGQS